jgi:Domain of unknown function (DUF4278)
MKLTYRGINYIKNSSEIETVETALFGTFLGRVYPVRRYNTSPVHPSNSELKYRGFPYMK